jgi:SAM-dependent methyltransferase
LAARVTTALDREGKLDRALEALGPISERDVVAVDPGEAQRVRWEAAGARLRGLPSFDPSATRALPDAVADTVVSTWSAFRGVDLAELAEADRILRPGGRLLVLHDYGRDDLATLRGDQPEYGSWSRRDGPFLTNGFRVRVIHCFWTFDDLDDARSLVAELFGAPGERLARELKRPRLSWNVAVYHRSRGGAPDVAAR